MNIYPSYKCNISCSFCGIHKLKGKTIDLNWIYEQLLEHPILRSNINILGGEPSILPERYQEDLINICIELSGEKPYYITNLYKISPFLRKCKPIISYDFNLREYNCLNNILTLDFPFAISTILTSYLVNDVGYLKYLKFINSLKLCYRADLDIYYKSKNCSIDYTPDNDKLLEFISKIMDHPKVNLAPYSAMKNNIDSSFMNISDYFALLPDNLYGVRMDYSNGPYAKFKTFEEAIEFFNNRIQNKLCNNCEFIKTCWYPCSDNICRGNKDMLTLFKRNLNG